MPNDFWKWNACEVIKTILDAGCLMLDYTSAEFGLRDVGLKSDYQSVASDAGR